MNNEIKEAYINGMSLTQIAKEFKVSRHRISHELKAEGVEIRTRVHELNESVFDVIDTEEKAYWLGFLYADGYIEHFGRYVIELAIKDEEHLERFKAFIGTTAPISPKNGAFRLMVGSKKLVEGCISHGLYRNKSLTLESIPELRDDLVHHFMRGYFDGDGSISTTRNQPLFRVMGTGQFLNDYVNRLGVRPTKLVVDKRRPNGALTFTKCGMNECMKIYDFLYRDATIFLERKQKRFAELKSHSKR